MIFRFERFVADDTAFRLTANGVAVQLEPKTLRLLLFLLQNRDRLVRKQEILDAVWGQTAVTESALTRSIALLRKALDDDSREPRFIETVPTAGYRFIANVETGDLPQPAMTSPQTPHATPAAPTTPHRFSGAALVGIVALCAFVAGATVWLARQHVRNSAPVIRSVAVLPLNDLSGDPSQAYFADGMTDELITELARIPNLRVVSRTSVTADRELHRSMSEIAHQLNVDAVVEGSTLRSGNRVRITAQLIDARTDRHLWAQSFEGSAADVMSLQDSVAQQIAQQARLVLLPSPPRPPINPAAHDAYLRGRYFFDRREPEHSAAAFQRAIELQPDYAPAYAGLADALDTEMAQGTASAEATIPAALAAAHRAVQLDPNNGEAYCALGAIQTDVGDVAAAERNLTRSLQLSPNYAVAELRYAILLSVMGKTGDAVAHMRRALELDPLSFFVNRHLGAMLYFDRHYDEAIQQLQRTSELDPDKAGLVYKWISWCYEMKGMHDQAVAYDLEGLRGGMPQLDLSPLRAAYQHGGWEAYTRARIEAMRSYDSKACIPFDQAQAYLQLGNHDQAIAQLNRGLQQHCVFVLEARADPLLDPIRQDPGYIALLSHLHF